MKQNRLKFFLSLAMVLCSISAFAYDFMVDSIAYNIVNETEVAVTSENSSSPRYSQLSEAVIPSTVTNEGITYTVTSIGANAFRETATLRSVILPPTIAAIGDSAFYKCNTLTGVYISSLEAWCNINFTTLVNNPLCYARHLFLNDQEITELVIPDGVTEIKDYAFANCAGFTTITIPDGVISIGKCAFRYNSNMTSVTIGETVKSIGANAFEYCKKLATVRVPDSVEDLAGGVFSVCDGLTHAIIGNSVTTLKAYVFYSCDRLKSVDIGNSVTRIEDGSFAYSRALSTLTIPKSVSYIDSRAFNYCYGLTSIEVDSENPYYDSRNNCNAIIQSSTNTLLKGCKNTVIPNTVEVIGVLSFQEVSMDSMPIPNSVKRIGHAAFWLCRSLKKIHIPSSVTLIDQDAFNGCSGVISMTVDADNPVYDSRDSCNAIIQTASDKLLYGCQNTVIPKSVKIIGYSAFEDIYGLTSVELGDSVTSIEMNAFHECRNLTRITLGKSLKTISGHAFNWCDKLESITLPATLTSIGEYGFYYCPNLKTIVSLAVTPPTMRNANTFSYYTTPILYVPEESLEAYRTTDCWSRFTNIVPIKKGDVNGDERLSISDVTALINVLLSGDTSAINVANADVNGDGKFNIADVTALIEMLLQS